MIREAPAMTVRNQLGELLNEVQYRGDSIMITKAGKPVAALVDMALFDRLRKLDENFEKIRQQFSGAFNELETSEIESLFDEAVSQTRK
jgi:prevent-host-death family protein